MMCYFYNEYWYIDHSIRQTFHSTSSCDMFGGRERKEIIKGNEDKK